MPRTLGGTDYFDADALAVAQAAAGFLQFGIEARHLKQFKSAAEREAGLFEQIVLPLLKQRNPARPPAGRRVARTAGAASVESLRGALVRSSRARHHGLTRCSYFGPMSKVRVSGVRIEMPGNSPVMFLTETEGAGRTLPIYIGDSEAPAIVIGHGRPRAWAAR